MILKTSISFLNQSGSGKQTILFQKVHAKFHYDWYKI